MMPPESSLQVTVAPSLPARLWRMTAGAFNGKGSLFSLLQAFGTQFLIVVINMTTGIITARYLGPQGRGEYVAITTWPQLLSMIAFSGLSSAVVFRMRNSPETAGRAATAALVMVTLQSLLAIAAGAVLLPFLMHNYSAAVLAFAQSVLIFAAFININATMRQSFAGIGAFSNFNLANLAAQGLHLVCLVALLLVAPLTPDNSAMALMCSVIVAMLCTLPRFVRLVRPRFAGFWREVPPLASFTARAALSDLVFAFAFYADRLVLIPLLPASELGFYAVAFSFSRVIQLPQPAITSVFLAQIARQDEEGAKRLHDHALRFLGMALLLGIAVLSLAGEPLLVFTYGPEFGAAKTVFRLLLVEASLGALSQVPVQLFLARNRPGVVSAIQGAVMGISVVSMLVLVPRYGGTGAAAVLVAAGLLRMVLLLSSMKLILRMELPRLHLRSDDWQYLWGRLR